MWPTLIDTKAATKHDIAYELDLQPTSEPTAPVSEGYHTRSQGPVPQAPRYYRPIPQPRIWQLGPPDSYEPYLLCGRLAIEVVEVLPRSYLLPRMQHSPDTRAAMQSLFAHGMMEQLAPTQIAIVKAVADPMGSLQTKPCASALKGKPLGSPEFCELSAANGNAIEWMLDPPLRYRPSMKRTLVCLDHEDRIQAFHLSASELSASLWGIDDDRYECHLIPPLPRILVARGEGSGGTRGSVVAH